MEHLNNPTCCYSLGACGRKFSDFSCISSSSLTPFVKAKYDAYRHELDETVSAKELFYKGCSIDLHDRVGDGICDQDIAEFDHVCCYDGSDCLFDILSTCPGCGKARAFWHQLREGKCMHELNNEECCYSWGNCAQTCSTCLG